MKKTLYGFLFLFSGLIGNAQTINQELLHARCEPFGDGFVVYGVEPNGTDATFILKYYDVNFKLKKQYSKSFEEDAGRLYSSCALFGKHIDVCLNGAPRRYNIRLSNELEELSFMEYNEQAKLEMKEISYDKDKIIHVDDRKIENSFGYYQKNINNRSFIDDDIVGFSLRDQSIIRLGFTSNSLTKGYYIRHWESPITGFKKVKSAGIIYSDEKDIVNCLITKGKNPFWDDCIVRLDAQTGNIKYQISTIFPDINQVFFLSNAYFDPETETIIAVGQLYNAKGKVKMTAMAMLVYDKDGKLFSSKKIDFSEYEIDAPRNFKLNKKSIVVHSIGKIVDGKYFVILLNNCESTIMVNVNGKHTPVTVPATIAYSYFEMDDKCNVENEKIQYRQEFKRRLFTMNARGNERYVLIKQIDDKSQIISKIDFSSGNANLLEEIAGIDYTYHRGDDSDNINILQAFAIDSKHAIIFNLFTQFSKSAKYEIKSIHIK